MKKIKLSESLKNVTKISSGTILGQIISIATLPVITRIYGANIVGIWTLINSIASIIENYSDIGLTNVLMMCEEEEKAFLRRVVCNISAFVTVISSVAVLPYYIISGNTVVYSLIITAMTILYSYILKLINIYSTILNRQKSYNVLMKNSTIRFLSSSLLSIAFGVAGLKQYGYFIGMITGQALAFLNMFINVKDKETEKKKIDYIGIIKKYRQYVTFQTLASLTSTLRTELPNVLINSFFGNTMLGYFSISQKLLTIPITFLGQALGKVFYQTIAEMKRKGQEISAYIDRNIRRGMKVALVPMVLFAAFGDAAVVMFFGEEFSVGGVICRIIVYRSLFNFISTSTKGIDIVLDKQQYSFYTCLLQTIGACLAIFAGYYIFCDIYITSFLIIFTFIVVQIWYFAVMYKMMGLKSLTYVKNAVLTVSVLFAGSFILRYAFIFVTDITKWRLLEYLAGFLC